MINDITRLRKALKETTEAIAANNEPVINDILTKVVIETLDRFQKKVNVGLQDSISDLLDQFKLDIEREIFEIGQQWTLATRHEKFLFPKNCRFVYSKGSSTIVVIEQEPIRRSITVDRGLFGLDLVRRMNQTSRVSLLFPYVIFVLQWKDSRLVNAYTAWRKEPIRLLSDPVFDPIMPNTHENYAICTGDVRMPSGDISLGSENVISSYWQSVFNTDLSNFWWNKKLHPKITTLETWVENSDDPFLFNDINLSSKHKTLENMVDFCCIAEVDPDSVELRKRLADKIELCTTDMFSKVMKYFKKTKFDRFYPKEVQENVALSMEGLLKEIYDILSVLQNDLDTIVVNSKNRKDVDNYGWQPRSSMWR